jgi:rare lipoprotein A
MTYRARFLNSALLLTIASSLVGCSSPALSTKGGSRSQPGKYYLDDGPMKGVTKEMVDALPEPTPRKEALRPANMRPYTVMGETYVPMRALAPYRVCGTGSWYGTRYHNQLTSSGERYDMLKFTAAHPTLPIPSYARVTNLDNGRSVIVRINDRGPFLRGRLIDLSFAAAMRLDYTGKGSAPVEVKLIVP